VTDPVAVERPDDLIHAAKAGGPEPLGRLLARYTCYLTLLARVEVGRHLQGKLDSADIVQEAFLYAHRHFTDFRGTTEAELVAWLRRILAGVLANTVRHYFGTKARDPRLEQDLTAGLDRSSRRMARELAASGSSPSEAAERRELSVVFADALGRLPDDYREVLLLRHFEDLTFPAVAERMGRSVKTVEKLWLRAVNRLRQGLAGQHVV
jgi:RNA polymerase sigma-70 factor (ECF subfamily)